MKVNLRLPHPIFVSHWTLVNNITSLEVRKAWTSQMNTYHRYLLFYLTTHHRLRNNSNILCFQRNNCFSCQSEDDVHSFLKRRSNHHIRNKKTTKRLGWKNRKKEMESNAFFHLQRFLPFVKRILVCDMKCRTACKSPIQRLLPFLPWLFLLPSLQENEKRSLRDNNFTLCLE